MKKAVTPLEKTAARVDLSAPWLGPEAALLDATSVGAWLDSLSLSPDARAALEVQFVANQGATSTYEINLLAFAALAAAHTDAQAGMSFFGDTETHRIRGGAQQLAERAARKLQHPVVLGCNLLGIERRKNGIRAMTSLGPFDADFIVVTIPASLWQHIELPDECRPPAVRMSSNTKFFVHTRRRAETFRAGLSPLALASSGESGLLQIFWEATEGQPGDEAVYAAFSGGPAAETLNSLPEQTRAERCLAEMELLFPGIGSLVTQTRFAGWPGKRWTLGGYSCPAPGDVLARWPSLREGAHPVHFAGEACSNFWGFMQGALDSAAQKAWHLYHHYDGCC